MTPELAAVLIAAISFAATFLVARRLGRGFRERRRQRGEEKRREGESRQVRRARERREKR